MMRVPAGRMGHREAYWPMDRRKGEHRDWAWRKRRPGSDAAEDVWLVCVGGKSLVKGKAAGPSYHQARRMAEAALEKVGAEQVSGGLADTDIVWRKGGVARRLGRDEQHS